MPGAYLARRSVGRACLGTRRWAVRRRGCSSSHALHELRERQRKTGGAVFDQHLKELGLEVVALAYHRDRHEGRRALLANSLDDSHDARAELVAGGADELLRHLGVELVDRGDTENGVQEVGTYP